MESDPGKIKFIHLAETDSTNSYARREASRLWTESPDCEALVVTAEEQSSGRGQRGTVWQSSKGKNLLMTIVVRPKGLAMESCYALSVASALALKESMQAFGLATTLKWPNDLYCNNCKLAGILLESDCERTNVTQAFIGIGLNINQSEFYKMERRPTSMSIVGGREFNVRKVMHTIVNKFIEKYRKIANGELSRLFDEYEKSLMGYSSPLLYRDVQGEFTACVKGVERDGRIVLECSDGTLRRYWFKEVENVTLGY